MCSARSGNIPTVESSGSSTNRPSLARRHGVSPPGRSDSIGAMKTIAICALSLTLLAGDLAAQAAADSASKPSLAVTSSAIDDGIYLVLSEREPDSLADPVPDGRVLLIYDSYILQPSERGPDEYFLLRTEPDVPLELGEAPEKGVDDKGRPKLHIALKEEYATLLEEFTTENVGRRVAIVIGGRIATAHGIKTPIVGGRIQITRCTDNACEVLLTELAK